MTKSLEKITKEILENFILKTKIELTPTQPRLCIPVINRIYKKMSANIKFSEIKVKEGLICDGHHRYLASLLAGISIGRVPSVTTLATTPMPWESIVLVDDDWDSETKINELNKIDAEFNEVPIEKIIELLK